MKYSKTIILVLALFLMHSCTIVSYVVKMKSWLPKSTPTTKEYLDTISFTVKYGWIVVEPEIKGESKKFVLDTGAPTILDYYDVGKEGVKTRPKKDLEPKESLRWALLKPSYVNKIEKLTLGKTTFKQVGAMTVTFPLFSTTTACENIRGIIGSNVMKDGVWSIRYEDKKIIITDNISKLSINKTYAFKMYPFSKMKNPTIEFPIGDTLVRALVDLGNSLSSINVTETSFTHHSSTSEQISFGMPNTLMFSPLASREIKKAETKLLKVKTNAFDKPIDFYVVDTLKIGYKDLSKHFSLVLGYDFLKNFNITFDWPNEMVYFEPIETEIEKEPIKEAYSFTIDFFNYDKKVYVMSVFPKHCDTTLVSVGDTVKAINGTPIEEIVGNNYCEFIKGNKSLLPDIEEPIKILLKDKTGKEKMAEMRKVKLFE